MGLLSSLGLPRLATLPSRAAPGKPVAAPTVKTASAPGRKPVGPVVDKTHLPSLDAGPVVKAVNVAEVETAPPDRTAVAAEAEGAAPTAPPPPTTTKEIGYGDVSLGLKESADGMSAIASTNEAKRRRAELQVWSSPATSRPT